MTRARGLFSILVFVAVMGMTAFLTQPVWASAVAASRLPDRSDPAVVAEQNRLADLAEATMWTAPEHTRCVVRLLRREGDVSWGWAICRGWSKGAEWTEGGRSVPLRVDGSTVTTPEDGARYARDVHHMFPWDLGEAVLAHDAGLLPPNPGLPPKPTAPRRPSA